MNSRSIFALAARSEAQAAFLGRAEEKKRVLPLEPLVIPTIDQVKQYLPDSLNPQFVYNSPQEEQQGIPPSFVVIGPVRLRKIIGDRGKLKEEAGDTQKFFEFETVTPDKQSPLAGRFWLSLNASKPDDFGDYDAFRNTHPPDALHSIVVPFSPPTEWRLARREEYRRKLKLTDEEAAFYEVQSHQVGAWALAGGDVDAYFATVDASYIRRVA